MSAAVSYTTTEQQHYFRLWICVCVCVCVCARACVSFKA